MKNLSCYLLDTNFPYGDELLAKVIDREQIIRFQHQEDIKHATEVSKGNGTYALNKSCRMLSAEAVPIIIEAIQAVVNKLEAGIATKNKKNIERLSMLPHENFAAIIFASMLNSCVNRDRYQTALHTAAKLCEIEAKMTHYQALEPRLYGSIMNNQHKMGKHIEHISDAMMITMHRRADGQHETSPARPELHWENWDSSFKNWLADLYMNIIATTTGLFEIKADYLNTSQLKRGVKTYLRIHPTDTLLNWLETTENKLGMLGGYYLPLPVQPRDWTTTQDGGYWTQYGGRLKLIKNFSSGFQEELLNKKEQLSRVVFPAVNAAQKTAWRINQKVYDVMMEMWEADVAVADLPSREPLPLPVCHKCGQPVDENHRCFLKDEAALTIWKRRASIVHHENISLKTKRLAIAYGLETAAILSGDERFYYVYQTDFRGRLYPCAQLNPQGSDWQKSLLEFADGVPLGKQGVKWLAIHVANCWGNDKVSFDDRYQWTLDNEQLILDCANYPHECLKWADADSPWCFLAACFEWAEYRKQGDTYLSRLAVALDGTCSGLQHYSAMLKDITGGIATNVIMDKDNPKREDIYQRVADKVIELVTEDVADAENGVYATTLLAHNLITRKIVKRPVMTQPYGSTYDSCRNYVMDELHPLLEASAVPDDIQKPIEVYLASVLWKAIPMVVQAARSGMDYLKQVAKLVSKDGLPVTWTTPTGFLVQQSYFETSVKRLRFATGGNIALRNNIPVWVQEQKHRSVNVAQTDNKTINIKRQISGIAPNFIHSLDSSHLMMSVLEASQNDIKHFALIHDSLGTHAGNTESFSKIIRECFYKLYSDHNSLDALTKSLRGQVPKEQRDKLPQLLAIGAMNPEDIKEALYLFS